MVIGTRSHPGRDGFTLIEMLAVMAIMATLLAVAAPRYFESRERARETVLKADLRAMREALDHFQADTGHAPKTLDDLVSGRYLRELPVDPMTGVATSWVPDPFPDGVTPGVHDVHSGAAGNGRDGSAYRAW